MSHDRYKALPKAPRPGTPDSGKHTRPIGRTRVPSPSQILAMTEPELRAHSTGKGWDFDGLTRHDLIAWNRALAGTVDQTPRLLSASIAADVDDRGACTPLDNDATRPLTIHSFGGDIGEQLRECIERPLRAVLRATVPKFRKGRR